MATTPGIASLYMPRDIALVELALQLYDELPGFCIGAIKEVLGIFDEEHIDIHHMPLNLLVVRPTAKLGQPEQ